MRITPDGTRRSRRQPLLLGHQRPLLLGLVVLIRPLRRLAQARILPLPLPAARTRVHPLPGRRPSHRRGVPGAPVLVHVPHGAAHAQEQQHEALLGEAGVVDQVGVDHVLQVAAAVVREQDVDRLCLLAAAALRGDGVVDAVDDSRAVREQLVRLDLLHGLRDRLGPERAADLLEREELRRGRVLDEVDVRKAALGADSSMVSL